MPQFKHGKNTVFKIGATDLSTFVETSEITMKNDTHDVTAYGASGHGYEGGLADDKVTFGGTYATDATGPRKILVPLRGTKTTFTRQPEGTGAAKPQDTGNGVVGQYVETSPAADMIKWTCEITVDGIVNSAPQP